MKFKMVHENYNVADLERSLAFYQEALGLTEKRRKVTDDFIIVYIGNAESDFELELTWLKDHPQAYDLGECEFHLAFHTDDFEAAYAHHKVYASVFYQTYVSAGPSVVRDTYDSPVRKCRYGGNTVWNILL